MFLAHIFLANGFSQCICHYFLAYAFLASVLMVHN